MPEHLHYHDDELFNPETHHEHSDVNVKAIIWFAVIFVVFAFITHFVVWGLFEQFVSMENKSNRREPDLTAIARPRDASVPKNQPLLQPFPTKDAKGGEIAPTSNTPVTDMADMRRREQEALTTYGWVDKTHGVVRIPIADAKRLALARIAVSSVTNTPAVTATSPEAAPQQPGNPATQQPPAAVPPPNPAAATREVHP